MEASLEIEVRAEGNVAEALYKALYPEAANPPSPECRASISLRQRSVIIRISCSRINLLRAAANSYLSIISMIIKSLEVSGYGRAETAPA